MCGITGSWGGQYSTDVAVQMAGRLTSRGPDDVGVWIEDGAKLMLAHRRLSILELSPAGAQPMVSPCGRYVLVFNGEIYNHTDLRRELSDEGGAFSWRGLSDTETLLSGLRHWGVEKCLQKLVGMFAFALWDKSEQLLYLARDRIGEKPLYYGCSGDTFLFGSELKALTLHPAWRGQLDRDALASFFRFGYVPTPWSIYKGIFKLPPAHFLVIKNKGQDIGVPNCYWKLNDVAANGFDRSMKSPEVLANELEYILIDIVKKQMMADVPLGVFLSGGIDSTMITALMQSQSNRPVKTFTIGFHEAGYSEAIQAKKVAAYLGTDHTELYVTPEHAISVVPKLSKIYDEPFADVSQVPTYLVSQLARKDVKVVLSGDGGDELFCGYNRYLSGLSLWSKSRVFPLRLRHLLSQLIERTPSHTLDRMQRLLSRDLQTASLADRLYKFSHALMQQDVFSYYRSVVSHVKNPTSLVLGANEIPSLLAKYERPNLSSLQEKMMFWDMLTYLPDGILTKVDRASMAVSLEVRAPFLDHRLVEFAWRVPITFKCHEGQGKWLLRQVLNRYVPKELMQYPKTGFSVPIEHWLRGPLRDWVESLLSEARIKQEGYLDPAPIRKMWNEHLTSRHNWQQPLWNVLMFQSWHQEVIG